MKRFPIQNGPSLPWEMIVPHERQVLENHGQSFERLAQRGGLDSLEMLCVLDGEPLRELIKLSGICLEKRNQTIIELEKRRVIFENAISLKKLEKAEAEIIRLRKLIREDHPSVGLNNLVNALKEPMECGHHVHCLDDETGNCDYCETIARAKKAETRLAENCCDICDDILGEHEAAISDLERDLKISDEKLEGAEVENAKSKACIGQIKNWYSEMVVEQMGEDGVIVPLCDPSPSEWNEFRSVLESHLTGGANE